MKVRLKSADVRLLLSLLMGIFLASFDKTLAQGSLTPAGAPGATMLTLSQVEPRTPISSLPFTISASGSYYVTANLTGAFNQNGIIVATDNVTIDLNGFTLLGGGGSSGEAIWSSTVRQNLVIRNGTVRNWPGSGINFYDSGSSMVTVQNIHSISNGFTGFAVKNGSRVTDCLAVGNGIRGILVDNDCVVEHCKAAGNTSLGIGAGANCQLRDNQSTGNGTGLTITGTSNIISGNIVRLNTANYSIAQGNQLDLLLCQVPETISWPAKVKLVGSMNVTSGSAITINANNVTIDLSGFTLSSTQNPAGPSGNGILVNGPMQNIAIANGFIQGGVTNNGSGVYSGSGFGYGINCSANPPMNVLVSHVTISGCQYSGIFLYINNSTVVESCSVQTVGGDGIQASTVKQSMALDCGAYAIYGGQISDCQGESSGSYGIGARTVQNCYGYAASASASVVGISAYTALNCYGYSNGGSGISANTAQNCNGISNGSGFGVYASYIASYCYGNSSTGTGVSAFIANVCHGTSSSGTPLSTSHNINSF